MPDNPCVLWPSVRQARSPGRTIVFARLLVLICTLVALGPAHALADGDPASDVLIGGSIFYPYAPVQAPVERALNSATATFHHHGQPIKLAIIASPVDLGAVSQVFDMPQAYAQFLSVELSYYDARGPLLVVMPNGFGAVHVSAAVLAVIRSLPTPNSRSSTVLAEAALRAESRIARADGFAISARVDGGAQATTAGGGGSNAGLIVLLAVIAVIGSVGLILTSAPVRRRWQRP